MRSPREWEACYQSGGWPWDTGRPDSNLQRLVNERPVRPCRVLDVGCGTGSNAIWLAQQGFKVTGIDLSTTAIAKAQSKAGAADMAFYVVDVLTASIPGGPYGVVFDRGCFHSFDAPQQRAAFAARLHEVLEVGGLWFSVMGSTDSPPRETGPPRRSALDIAMAVESHFEIVLLQAGHFDSDQDDPPPAWLCLMRRR